MAKATVKIKDADGKKHYVAGRINQVKLGNRVSIGNGESLLEIEYKDPAHLVDYGKSLAVVTGNEFDEQIAKEKLAAEAKAKKDAENAKLKKA